MKHARLGLLLVAALASPAAGFAQEGYNSGLDPLERLPSTIRGELPLAHRTVLGVVVGRDSLADVEKLLGPAERFAPVGSADVVALCYEWDDDEDGSVIVFQADPKDPRAVVLMAHATRRIALRGMARHCQPSTALRDGVSTAAGVQLGMSHDAFIARFVHLPSEDHPRYTGFYFYDLVEPRPDAGARADSQLLSGVRMRTRAGQSRAFSVYRFYRGRGC